MNPKLGLFFKFTTGTCLCWMVLLLLVHRKPTCDVTKPDTRAEQIPNLARIAVNNVSTTRSIPTPTDRPSTPDPLPDKIDLPPKKSGSWVPSLFYKPYHNSVNFTYTFVNDEPCQEGHVFLLITVRSEAKADSDRMLIRETWGKNRTFNNNLRVVVRFLLGEVEDRVLQLKLAKENRKFHDLIQARFHDSYRNLPMKTVMAYDWARNKCPRAKYFMMADSDILVDVFKLTRYLYDLSSKSVSSYTLCKVEWTERPWRPQSGNKAAMSVREYPSDEFASYCWGGAYVAPIPVINKLYLAAKQTPMISIDDVWTGILAERAGISFPPTSEAFILPWHNTHGMLNHIKYHDGPIMIAAYHGSHDVVHEQIRGNWKRIADYHDQFRMNEYTLKTKPRGLGN